MEPRTEPLATAAIGPPAPCLSVVMPCFNEERTAAEAVERVLASPYTAEVLAVDDGSTDATAKLLAEAAAADARVRVLTQPANRGKGAAVCRGFAEAAGPFVVVQDADLEYDPEDFERLLAPLLDGRADVVYGSRFVSGGARRV
ncbi:MAG: glycosyltransferase family 2 protein, partial [Acidimicrobiales bacterium]